MSIETGVVVGFNGEPIFWHLPEGRNAGYLPDSRALWEVLWENRNTLYGFAHSHPGIGYTSPSWEDITTFAAVERGLGRRLVWWITSADRLITLMWGGPGKHDYSCFDGPAVDPPWLEELRRLSYTNGV